MVTARADSSKPNSLSCAAPEERQQRMQLGRDEASGRALRGLARQARRQQRRQRGRAPGRRRQVDRRQQLAPRDRLLAQARVRRLRVLPSSEATRGCSHAGEGNQCLTCHGHCLVACGGAAPG